MSTITGNATPFVLPQSDVESLKGQQGQTLEQEKARLKKATEEFESFFMYYMLKTMRETVPETSMSEDNVFTEDMGKDIFDQLFDMHLSKNMSVGGESSISDILYNSMEKLIETKYKDSPGVDNDVKPLGPETDEIYPLSSSSSELQVPDENKIYKVEKPEDYLPIANMPKRAVTEDRILSQYGKQINEAAKLTSLDPALIYSVIKVESNGNASAVSHAGARGLMQLVDSTASDYGVKNVFDPGENIRAGSNYLKDLTNRYDSLELALAAYNAGPSNVDKYGDVPPFKETESYVNKVMETFNTVQKLYSKGLAKVR